MATPWCLRCMNGSGSSPGLITDFPLIYDTDSVLSIVRLANGGNIDLREENTFHASGDIIIASLRVSPPCFLLEALTDDVVIEAGSGNIHLPNRTFVTRHFIRLRPEDVVSFQRQQVKFQFLAPLLPIQEVPIREIPPPLSKKMRQSVMGSDSDDNDNDVQVQSSLADTEAGASPQRQLQTTHPDEDTDSNADDVDTPTVRTTRTPGMIGDPTPATSRPTDEPQVNLMIEETPVKRTESGGAPLELHRLPPDISNAAGEDGITSSDMVRDPDSPLAKRGDTQASASTLVQRMTESDKSQNVFADVRSPRSRITYGKQSRKSTPAKPERMARQSSFKKAMQGVNDSELGTDPVMTDGLQENTAEAVDAKAEQSDFGATELTSDTLHSPHVAREGAVRSMHGRSKKRKLPSADADGDVESDATSNKRAKKVPVDHLSSPGTGPSDEMPASKTLKTQRRKQAPAARRIGSLHEESHGANANSSPASNRAIEVPTSKNLKPQRRTEEPSVPQDENGDEDTSDSDEEVITVAESRTKAKPSPQVKLPRSRKTPTASATPSAMIGKIPKVLLSHSEVNDSKKFSGFLKNQGVQIVDTVPSRSSHFICVTSSDLATTAKVLRSIALGKDIVTDDWIKESHAAGTLLPISDYLHPTIASPKSVDRRSLFKGKILHFTHALCQSYGGDWANVEVLAKEAGAKRVIRATRKAVDTTHRDDMIYLGRDENDPDVITLMETEGRIIHRRDLLSQSVLRGVLVDDDEELMIQRPVLEPEPEPQVKGKAKKGRKSR